MIERNRGDRADRRLEDISRVEPSAEANFDDRDLHACASEDLEADSGRRFKKCRRIGKRAIPLQTIGAVQNVCCCSLEGVVVDSRISDEETLVQVNEMRRRVTSCANSRSDKRRVNHGGDGTLAVGAGDVKREERAFGMIQRLAQAPYVLETQLDAEGLERKKTLEQSAMARLPLRT